MYYSKGDYQQNYNNLRNTIVSQDILGNVFIVIISIKTLFTFKLIENIVFKFISYTFLVIWNLRQRNFETIQPIYKFYTYILTPCVFS